MSLEVEVTVSKFPLWVNYQTLISCYFGEYSTGYGLFLSNPERPESRSWKRCLGEVAVFNFKNSVSHQEVIDKIKELGFEMADIWCLSSMLRNWPMIQTTEYPLDSPVCIVAPKTIVSDGKNRFTPFANVIGGVISVDFIHREKNSREYWLRRWKILAVRWLGETKDDFWTPEYKPERAIIGGRFEVFDV